MIIQSVILIPSFIMSSISFANPKEDQSSFLNLLINNFNQMNETMHNFNDNENRTIILMNSIGNFSKETNEEIFNLKYQDDMLKRDNIYLKKENIDLIDRVGILEKEFYKLDDFIDNLKAENVILKDGFANFSKKTSEEIFNLKYEVEMLKRDNIYLKKENIDLIDRVGILEKGFYKLDDFIDNLKDENVILKDGFANFTARVRKLENFIPIEVLEIMNFFQKYDKADFEILLNMTHKLNSISNITEKNTNDIISIQSNIVSLQNSTTVHTKKLNSVSEITKKNTRYKIQIKLNTRI
jgi:predicted nuclease with TOPRIM domain